MIQVDQQVEWGKCEALGSPGWCALDYVDENLITGEGVYLIWVSNGCVYVGQGKIADRIREHRDPNTETGKKIAQYRQYGTLGVTWALVNESIRDGVESFLIQAFRPAINVQTPTADPIRVNLPT